MIACRYELLKKKKKKNICTYIIVFFLPINSTFEWAKLIAVLEMTLVILNLFFYYFKHQTAKL